jgi:uncharacterized protein (DUF1778 family)
MSANLITIHKESQFSIGASETEKEILAQAEMIDQSEFRLPPAQWQAFCERLNEPARMIPALRDLFREPEPTE